MKLQANLLRILLYFFALVFALVVKDGISIFKFTTITIIFSFILYFFSPPKFYKLSIFFELGFLFFLSTEGIANYQNIIYETSYEYFCIGSKYINLSFIIIMVVCLYRTIHLHEQNYITKKVFKLKNVKLLYFTLIFFIIVFLGGMVGKAFKVGSVGRLGAASDAVLFNDIPVRSLPNTFFNMFGSLLSVVLPPLLLFLKNNYNNKIFKILAYTIIPISLVLQIFNGGRTLLLHTLIAILIINQIKVGKINWSKTLIIGIIMVFLSSFMLTYRNYGFTNIEISSVSNRVGKDIIGAQDVVLWLCRIVEYYDYHPNYEHGNNLLTIFVFWVPRAIWLTKPTQIDYWFARTYIGDDKFTNTHSIATGFSGSFYSDFGYWGGLISCIFIGLFIAKLEYFVYKSVLNKTDPFIIFSSIIFGATFFFIRQFSSILPTIISCYLIILFLKKIFFEIK